jgi:hypothetical protein
MIVPATSDCWFGVPAAERPQASASALPYSFHRSCDFLFITRRRLQNYAFAYTRCYASYEQPTYLFRVRLLRAIRRLEYSQVQQALL